MWTLPEEPRKRTLVCLRLVLLAPTLAALLAGTFLVIYTAFPSVNAACPPWAVQAVLMPTVLGGAGGAALAAVQLPIRYWRRIAAGVVAFVLGYLLSGVLCVVFTELMARILGPIMASWR